MEIGPFRGTPYLVDHSAFDAYALPVEADGKRVFYSATSGGTGADEGFATEGAPERAMDLGNFSNKRPILLLVLANHDRNKSKPRHVLDTLPECPNVDLRIATTSFFGYGLYDQGVHTVEVFRKRFPDYIHSGFGGG